MAAAQPLQTRATAWTPAAVRVALNVTLDGCIVPSSAEGVRVDTAHCCALDGLADDEVCASIRERLCGAGGAQPPAELWEPRTADSPDAQHTFGLRDEAMRELERSPPEGVLELQSRLALLYSDHVVCHPPLLNSSGATVCGRFVANAAVHGDTFQWHLDADPSSLPPSEWTAAHGSYTNRERGKPLFVSCILYLDADWPDDFEAETHFLDRQTSTGFFVRPKCGRVVMMDSDLTHRLSPPSSRAGRPRFSLVWKVRLHVACSSFGVTDASGAAAAAAAQ